MHNSMTQEQMYYKNTRKQSRLFRTVVLHSIMECFGVGLTKMQCKKIMNEATQWFIENGEDFQRVCHLARLDSDHIRKKAIILIGKYADQAPMNRNKLSAILKLESTELDKLNGNDQEESAKTVEGEVIVDDYSRRSYSDYDDLMSETALDNFTVINQLETSVGMHHE